MITKLKWLTEYFERDIKPAIGDAIGKILYTTKNTTGRRVQYVIDLDTKTAKTTTINAQPFDRKLSPGAIDVDINITSPGTDIALYDIKDGTKLPVIKRLTTPASLTQTIANGASITAVNILTGVNRDKLALSTPISGVITMTVISQTGLTLNTTTGVVTLNSNTIAGTYTCNYKIADKYEPTIFVTGTVTITVLD